MQRRLTQTAAYTKSFATTAQIAELWNDRPVCSRTVARVAEEVGEELVDRRNAMVDDFTHHRRHPEGVDPRHDMVAVFVDGGRVQLRAEGLGHGVYGKRWAEDKVARLQTMTSQTFLHDPCPNMPDCFQRAILSATKPAESPDDVIDWLEHPPSAEPAPPWQPKPQVRTCVATMEELDDFRWMVQAEAKRRHFFTATRRAFVADGSHGNWTLWERHFPDFVPILDFVHASEYMHGAAQAVDRPTQGVRWAEALWQGRCDDVIAELRALLDERGIGIDDVLKDDHPLVDLYRAWSYLKNARGRTDYPRYRREGLPTTSCLIESQIKEYNYRMKGTEKFWNESNAESLLEVISWTLREDGPTLKDHFHERRTSPFRRNYEPTIAA